jgi:hypothetical protein
MTNKIYSVEFYVLQVQSTEVIYHTTRSLQNIAAVFFRAHSGIL